MKPITLLLISVLFVTSCTQSTPAPVVPCVHETVEIQSINVLGKSGNNESQGYGGALGAEAGAVAGCIIGGPIGCVVGGVVGAVGGSGLGTLDKSIDYEAHTSKGLFICQGDKCENLEERQFIKKDNTLTSTYCSPN